MFRCRSTPAGEKYVQGCGVSHLLYRQGCSENLPLRTGKGWYYEGGIRVPVIIHWPNVTRPGTVSDELIMSTDLYPTLLDMADLPLRPDQHMDGISLASHLREQKTLERDTLFWHYPHYHNLGQKPASVLRQGDFKLIEYLKDDRVELFDLDPEEQVDLAATLPNKAKNLKYKLDAWRAKVNAQMP